MRGCEDLQSVLGGAPTIAGWKSHNYRRMKVHGLPAISFEEYAALKKESLRRTKISDTLTYRNSLKEFGLFTKEQIDRLVQLDKKQRDRGMFGDVA